MSWSSCKGLCTTRAQADCQWISHYSGTYSTGKGLLECYMSWWNDIVYHCRGYYSNMDPERIAVAS